jgi:hypothetical protein
MSNAGLLVPLLASLVVVAQVGGLLQDVCLLALTLVLSKQAATCTCSCYKGPRDLTRFRTPGHSTRDLVVLARTVTASPTSRPSVLRRAAHHAADSKLSVREVLAVR